MTQAKYFRPLAIITLLIILITAFWTAGIKQITVLEDGETRHYRVFAFTVGGALLAAEIDLVEQDTVEPANRFLIRGIPLLPAGLPVG